MRRCSVERLKYKRQFNAYNLSYTLNVCMSIAYSCQTVFRCFGKIAPSPNKPKLGGSRYIPEYPSHSALKFFYLAEVPAFTRIFL